MQKQKPTVRIVAFVLILFSVAWIGMRFSANSGGGMDITPGHKYEVTYEFEIRGDGDYWVNTYLPISSSRQHIEAISSTAAAHGVMSLRGENKMMRWAGEVFGVSTIQHSFTYRGRDIKFSIDSTLQYEPVFDPGLQPELASTENIQVNHPKIDRLATELTAGKTSLLGKLQALYDFVYEIPAIATSDLTDALTTLEQYEASCNGKSRLFTALCRNQRIPTRLVGGLILDEGRKKTSHLWAEVYVQGLWVPMDALNGHFASLPAHYLELYRGDEFLITRKGGVDFDYIYDIRRERVNHYPNLAMLDLWSVADEANIPESMLQMLLLLPLGAFLVTVCKNVVGIKTFGVFLPVLVSLALIQTGLVAGIVLFSSIVAVVALFSFPLEKWGVQYTSKIALMLIAVVLTSLFGINLLHKTQWLSASAPLFFPIIILTIISERFAKKVEEEGVKMAMNLYGQTLLVTLFIYFILSSAVIQHFVMTFPESILTLAGLNLLLGKWIGLRLTEYHRFYQVTNA
ncbi:MAG: hypothetical protein Roseis2KO_24690 [Roseivirga sp.]